MTRSIRGGGYNRVVGPEVKWWPTGTDSVNAEFLMSSTQNGGVGRRAIDVACVSYIMGRQERALRGRRIRRSTEYHVQLLGEVARTRDAQYVSTDRNPACIRLRRQVLYSYKVNWQTVLYLGYGDDRALTVGDHLARLDRTLFLKVSYAIQR